jgi:hypothetical protein
MMDLDSSGTAHIQAQIFALLKVANLLRCSTILPLEQATC